MFLLWLDFSLLSKPDTMVMAKLPKKILGIDSDDKQEFALRMRPTRRIAGQDLDSLDSPGSECKDARKWLVSW